MKRRRWFARQRRLLEARTLLRVCSGATCPAAIRADCVEWLDQLARSLPTVVVTARAKGVDLADVRVFIDGKLIAERLSGAALEVDPGQHQFRFEAPPWPTVERNVLVSEGVKDRSIDVVFAPPDEPPPIARGAAAGCGAADHIPPRRNPTTSPAASRWPASPRRLFRRRRPLAEKRQLEQDCAPDLLGQRSRTRVRTKLLVADIALGVAFVSLVVGVYLHLTGRGTF